MKNNRQSLRRDAAIFSGLTLVFWLCASLNKKFQAHPIGMWVVYGAILLFIAYGFLTIARTIIVRSKEDKSWLVSVLAAIAAFLFISIGGPLLFAWLTLRTAKKNKV